MTKKYLLCFFILLATTFASNLLSPASSKVQATHMQNSGPAAVDNKVQHFVYLPLIVREGPALLPPSIVAQPLNATVTEPEAAAFTVVAVGATPLSYQWRRNGAHISGATSAAYALNPTSVGDDGAHFTVVVSNPYGSVTSQVATLTVMPAPVPPQIVAQPNDLTVTEPAAATFSVTASGDAPLTYQWRRNGANINGATNPSYVLNSTSVIDSSAEFDVVVSNPHGNVTSQAATLTVLPPPVPPQIDTQPASVTVTEPAAATFSVTASGDEPLTYQWRRNGANISGATSASYTLNPTSIADDGAQFDVVVSNPHGSATSQAATLTVIANTPPQAMGDAYSILVGGTIDTVANELAGVLDNDHDVDGDLLTAILLDDVTHGTLDLNPDGSFTYIHSGPSTVAQQLLPGSGNSLREYGVATAIEGDTLVIGSNSAEGGKDYAGAAYVFVRHDDTWELQAKLRPSDPAANQFFGWAVDISGNTIVVGAPGDSTGGKTYAGAAYVFVRSGSTWSQQGKLIAADTAERDEFGGAVVIDGNTVAVGAYFNDHAGQPDAGAAYVFTRSGTSWSQRAKLTAADPSAGAWLGLGLAIDGNTVAVGALNDDEAGTNAGATYVFVGSGASWSQQTKLTAMDAAPGNTFGFAVALQGDLLVVGANGYESSGSYAGAAYVFGRSGTNWSTPQKLVAADTTSVAGLFGFGTAVALAGDTIVVGAPGDDTMATNSGAAYVFIHSGSTWIQQDKLFALSPAANEEFGAAMAVYSDDVVVGANSAKFNLVPDNKPGAAYAYKIGGVLADSFTYMASDGINNSNAATVTITLEPAP